MTPVVAEAVTGCITTRSVRHLRNAAGEVPASQRDDYLEFLVTVALELARLGSSMVTEVLELREELKT